MDLSQRRFSLLDNNILFALSMTDSKPLSLDRLYSAVERCDQFGLDKQDFFAAVGYLVKRRLVAIGRSDDPRYRWHCEITNRGHRHLDELSHPCVSC
jgi:hypothetical protein